MSRITEVVIWNDTRLPNIRDSEILSIMHGVLGMEVTAKVKEISVNRTPPVLRRVYQQIHLFWRMVVSWSRSRHTSFIKRVRINSMLQSEQSDYWNACFSPTLLTSASLYSVLY